MLIRKVNLTLKVKIKFGIKSDLVSPMYLFLFKTIDFQMILNSHFQDHLRQDHIRCQLKISNENEKFQTAQDMSE